MSSLFSKTITLRKDLKITGEEFRQLRDFIYAHSGIFIADSRRYLLENRLANRVRELNLNTFGEYLYFLKYDQSKKAEMVKLFEAVTTNETSFFRNPPQLKVFQEKILANLLRAKRNMNDKRLRIWSAGCSTGEEPYTLAMILHEVLRFEIGNWDIRITANDLSEGVLQSARKGVYNEYSLRTTPKEIVARYFDRIDKSFSVKPEIRNMVTFGSINLSDKLQMKRVERSHIIFCRNVIIYFDEEMKKRVIAGFYDNLLPGGHLFIGHSESLHNLSRALKPEHYSGGIVYRREE
ncbi:MAG: CheR family methyltransferase [Desulfovibrionales bacterium]